MLACAKQPNGACQQNCIPPWFHIVLPGVGPYCTFKRCGITRIPGRRWQLAPAEEAALIAADQAAFLLTKLTKLYDSRAGVSRS